METNSGTVTIGGRFKSLYSLEKLIEWKRSSKTPCSVLMSPLYSLEKLIEWKLQIYRTYNSPQYASLYSLEKLIEWKVDLDTV